MLEIRNWKQSVAICATIGALLTGCGTVGDNTTRGGIALYGLQLALPDAVPMIAAPRDAPGDVAAEAASLASAAAMVAARPARRIEPASAAMLYATAWGRTWLAAPGERSMVAGEPGARCPAMAIANAADPITAVADAMSLCRADLVATGAPDDCACRLIAFNDTLLAPLDAFAYASGTAARLIGLGGPLARPLIAREAATSDQPGDSLVVLGDAAGPVATVALSREGRAIMELVDGGRVLSGWREPMGWRRGRMTERLLLRDEDGRRVIALIGVDPEEFLRDGLRLAVWPQGLPG